MPKTKSLILLCKTNMTKISLLFLCAVVFIGVVITNGYCQTEKSRKKLFRDYDFFFVRKNISIKKNEIFLGKVTDGKIILKKKTSIMFDKYQNNLFWVLEPGGNLCYLTSKLSGKIIKLYLTKLNIFTWKEKQNHILDYPMKTYFNNIKISSNGMNLLFSEISLDKEIAVYYSQIYILNINDIIKKKSRYLFIEKSDKRQNKQFKVKNDSYELIKPLFTTGQIWNVELSPKGKFALYVFTKEPMSFFACALGTQEKMGVPLIYSITEGSEKTALKNIKTSDGFNKVVWSPNENRFLYENYKFQDNQRNHLNIMIYDLQKMETKKIYDYYIDDFSHYVTMDWTKKGIVVIHKGTIAFIGNTNGKYKTKKIKIPGEIKSIRNGRISPCGNFVMFFGRKNQHDFIFVYDKKRKTLMEKKLESLNDINQYYGSWISNDGLSVARVRMPSPIDIFYIKKNDNRYWNPY